jgi:hypothetical protein
MMTGIVGKLFTLSTSRSPVPMEDDIMCGNGKTMANAYFCLLDSIDRDRWVITNYHTDFSTYMGAQEIFDEFFERENVTYGITEIQKFLNSLGKTQNKVWVEGAVSQRRKLGADIIWDSQRVMSVDNRIREHTKVYLIPKKFHKHDGTPCFDEDCMQPHFIKVYCDKPLGIIDPIAVIDCEEMGAHYNTNELCLDNLAAPGVR